jgi:DNA-binding winged helix-turn-helix (wHTH) protein
LSLRRRWAIIQAGAGTSRLRVTRSALEPTVVLQFGDFVLDTDTRQLQRRAREIHISPKAFALLAHLVEQRPNAVSKADLQEHLWSGTFVVEANLANLIAELRAALADDARQPRFIRTVHGFGYAFCGAATSAAAARAPSATCVLVRDRRVWPLVEGENILGRDGDAASWFDSTSVSRRHARIVIDTGRAVLEDLASKNGTFVGDERVRAPVALADGDRIRLGSFRVIFRVHHAQPSTETQLGE